jgi:hypothetical protein
MLVAVSTENEVQGLLAVLRRPQRSRMRDDYVVYLDYLESAPWNLRNTGQPPRFLGVGTVLMAEAIRMSHEEGFEGRVGLHSLPQAETFYEKCKMTRVGIDPRYYDLIYFEYAGQHGLDWLKSLGEFL